MKNNYSYIVLWVVSGLILISFGFMTAHLTNLYGEVIFGERPFIDIYEVPDEAMENNWFRIKFENDWTEHLDEHGTVKDPNGIVLFDIPELDVLNQIINVHTATRLFDSPALTKEYDWRHRLWGFHLWYELHFDSEIDIRDIIMEYRYLEGIVVWAEPEYKKELATGPIRWTPDDPLFTHQWHYNNTGQAGGTPGADISMIEAWDLEKGLVDVIVAIIDSGIQEDHPDLQGNMWDDIGWNFVNDNHIIIPGNHGTHVAGTVAALTNNDTGVAGVAGGSGINDGVRLMSCQVFTEYGSGGFHLAPIYAADNGAAISQNSWGYTVPGVYDWIVLNAIDYFNANGGGYVMNGGISFFAAGNGNSPGEWYPACYSGAFSVAATNDQDQKAWYSNYDTWVDISAPGGETNDVNVPQRGVLSTITHGNYAYYQGTSMACPHVSGVAALIISAAYRNGFILRNDVITNIIRDTADNHYADNPAYIGMLGTGRLNAYNALMNIPRPFAGGSGTEHDRWQIATAEHLNNVRDYVGENHGDKYFIQVQDIDLGVFPWNEDEGWVPIGSMGLDVSFQGNYDGNGRTINNMFIDRDEDYQGLFGYVHLATISNVGLTNANVTGTGSVGSLVGYNYHSTIDNCYSTGNVTGVGISSIAGGLIGINIGYVYDSYSEAVVSGDHATGGLVGRNQGVFWDSYSIGTVTGNVNVGGLAGISFYSSFQNCYFSGTVEGANNIGGLVGYHENSGVYMSYSDGSVYGEENVGGLVGNSSGGYIHSSYNKGTVSGDNYIGGLAGCIIENTQVMMSYSTGRVSGNTNVGGLIGESSNSTVSDSFWDIVTSGQEDSAGGAGLMTFVMVRDNTAYANWDFQNIWAMTDYTTYPYLQWQAEPGVHNYPPNGYHKVFRGREFYWESFPVLRNRDAQGDQPAQEVLYPLTYHNHIEVRDEGIGYMHWDGVFWFYQDPVYFNSTRGYQITFADESTFELIVEGDTGVPQNIPFGEDITIYPQNELLENWIGYFIPQTQYAELAFHSIQESLKEIQAEEWGMYRLPCGGWIHDGNVYPTVVFGKMYKVTALYPEVTAPFDFNWPVPTEIYYEQYRGEPGYFAYEEKSSYESFFIEEIEDDEDVLEVAVYAGDECVGASVFPGGYPLEILAYTDESHLNEEISFAIHRSSQRGKSERIRVPEVKDLESGEFTAQIVKPLRQRFTIVRLGAGEEETDTIIKPEVTLSQNYPNPFVYQEGSRSSLTEIPFYLSVGREVTLTIYNIRGQQVRTLYKGMMPAGQHSIGWNGLNDQNRSVGSGVYFYRLECGDKVITRKMLLVR